MKDESIFLISKWDAAQLIAGWYGWGLYINVKIIEEVIKSGK